MGPTPRVNRVRGGPEHRSENLAWTSGFLDPWKSVSTTHRVPLEGLKQRITLAALLTVAGDVAPLDRLIDWLWGRRPPRSAATIVQAHISRLRRLLDPQHRPWGQSEILVRRPPGLPAVHRAGPARRAAVRVRSSAGAGPRWSRCELEEPPRAAQRGARPVARSRAGRRGLRRGRPGRVVRLEALRMGATTALIDAELALGRHDELVPRLEALVQEHPFDERLSGQLMIALWRCRPAGRLAQGVRARARPASPASCASARPRPPAHRRRDPRPGSRAGPGIQSRAFTGRRG